MIKLIFMFDDNDHNYKNIQVTEKTNYFTDKSINAIYLLFIF